MPTIVNWHKICIKENTNTNKCINIGANNVRYNEINKGE